MGMANSAGKCIVKYTHTLNEQMKKKKNLNSKINHDQARCSNRTVNKNEHAAQSPLVDKYSFRAIHRFAVPTRTERNNKNMYAKPIP